jgi:flagellar motor switch protein FliN/FliY
VAKRTESKVELATDAAPAVEDADAALFPEVTASAGTARPGADLSPILDLNLPCYFELGGTRLSVSELLGLTRGSVVVLDRMIGEPGRFVVAGKEFAHGEVVALEGGYYGIRITQVVAKLPGREAAD